ncbi:hypothetical protein Tco_1043576 [Tanacetum coccineum]|uniref:Uncharacterized protein n=1 Tax=Tanacetum coccineum TaxID=301880 RepID=A0ABQ5GMH0_9ASTR
MKIAKLKFKIQLLNIEIHGSNGGFDSRGSREVNGGKNTSTCFPSLITLRRAKLVYVGIDGSLVMVCWEHIWALAAQPVVIDPREEREMKSFKLASIDDADFQLLMKDIFSVSKGLYPSYGSLIVLPLDLARGICGFASRMF